MLTDFQVNKLAAFKNIFLYLKKKVMRVAH